MKHLSFKSVVFGLLFAVAAGFLSVNVLADDGVTPVKRISWVTADSGDGTPPGDTTDGGIRTPGPGH